MVHAHLVDLVEQEQWVLHTHLGQLLKQLAGQGTNVGFAVATNLRFITDAAQRHTRVLAIGRASDRLAKRGLANTGRAYQTENRALHLFHPALNRQILQDALLHFIQAVVILVQDVAGLLYIVTNTAAFFPGNGQHPVDVTTHHRCLCRHR